MSMYRAQIVEDWIVQPLFRKKNGILSSYSVMTKSNGRAKRTHIPCSIRKDLYRDNIKMFLYISPYLFHYDTRWGYIESWYMKRKCDPYFSKLFS